MISKFFENVLLGAPFDYDDAGWTKTGKNSARKFGDTYSLFFGDYAVVLVQSHCMIKAIQPKDTRITKEQDMLTETTFGDLKDDDKFFITTNGQHEYIKKGNAALLYNGMEGVNLGDSTRVWIDKKFETTTLIEFVKSRPNDYFTYRGKQYKHAGTSHRVLIEDTREIGYICIADDNESVIFLGNIQVEFIDDGKKTFTSMALGEEFMGLGSNAKFKFKKIKAHGDCNCLNMTTFELAKVFPGDFNNRFVMA